MTVKEFKLPDPGEGLTEAEIVTWRVKPGDTVKVNDIVVEIETAKSLVELPVPFGGTVARLLVEEGETVEVGTPIIAVDTAPGGAAPVQDAPAQGAVEPGIEGSPAPKLKPEEDIEEGKIGGTTSTGRTAVLVGYGVKQTEAKRRPRKATPGAGPFIGSPEKGTAPPTSVPGESAPLSGEAVPAVPAVPAPEVQEVPEVSEVPQAPEPPAARAGGGRALAKPPVRKFAKDLGVDLDQVLGSGEGGIITRSDVEAHAAGQRDGRGTMPEVAAPAGPPAYGSAFAAGPGLPVNGRGETRTPIKGVRKMTAQAMVSSAFTAPHVTEWATVDVSRTMDLVERLKKDREFADVKVTPLLVLAKAMCIAVRRNPGINATWDEQAQEIAVKHFVNLGIAAATPRGLIVPNIKDADLLTMRQLAEAIGALTATAREGRTQPAEMSGGTITITNVGVFGVDTGTPILNAGEAAIMAFGAIRRMPWVVTAPDGTESIEPRWVTQLGLSFDHRLVDGELGSRYLADVAAILEDPAKALVWG